MHPDYAHIGAADDKLIEEMFKNFVDNLSTNDFDVFDLRKYSDEQIEKFLFYFN